MTKSSDTRDENALLAALPFDERQQIARELEDVRLPFKVTLEDSDKPLAFVWFLRSGVASSISTMADGTVIELATTGREGFVGLAVLMGATHGIHNTVIQVEGYGDRLPVVAFKRLLAELPSLQPLLLRYSLAFMAQIAQAAACNRIHPAESRCASWLLQTHDRVHGDRFPMTQEFLSQMLGLTRPSVSVAAGMLQKAGYIRYARGIVDVLDREGLEGASCECHEIIQRQYRRIVGQEPTST